MRLFRWSHRHRSIVVATGATFIALGLGTGWALASTQTASRADLDAMSGSATLPSSPATVWSMTKDASALCAIVPVCSSAQAVRGKPGTFVMTINHDLTLGGIDPLGAIPVTLTITDEVPGQSVGVHIEVDGKFGTFTSDATLSMSPDGAGGTRATYQTNGANGTGVIGRLGMGQMSQSLQGQLSDAATEYSARTTSRPPSLLRVSTARGRAGAMIVTAMVAITAPEGYPATKAAGRMVVYTGSKVACRARIVDSVGRCTMRVGSKAATSLVTTSGFFDNGIDYVLGARVRIPGASR